LVSGDTSTYQVIQAPFEANVSQQFAVQPALYLRDANDEPVPGRAVVAFANPDPTWPPTGWAAATGIPEFARRGQKHGRLMCDTATLSDANGIARFTCLGINSSSYRSVNIVFAGRSRVLSVERSFLFLL
jgi:hypothetical protein